ncbi:2-oxoacid:acceptor oxidoreductase family protein [Moorella sp. Hama-1]|uniref:2-oxoacid:acceptor oxidoreductase family protein n=1 Tax=Moorella sp. Hama-1 TaxID=2138101 RepID=UPI000D65B68F|nr:2-oxoacid:acceptor oxidoreductase family protein [Moorella sp. Hama-1]BCV22296.1 pyruvate ferredoxin oxidoreductase subunit gamma [Moorella sp. Hama-1]
MLQIRWHGRGGQGAVTAARIFARAAALYAGRYAQSFPSFGTERRGAPVTAFTRLDDRPIRDRSQIANPNYIVVLDATLLENTDVFAGLASGGIVLINSVRKVVDNGDDRNDRDPSRSGLHYLDATHLAREILGVPIVNTAMVGALAGLSGLLPVEAVARAIADVLPERLAARNSDVARQAFDLMAGHLSSV